MVCTRRVERGTCWGGRGCRRRGRRDGEEDGGNNAVCWLGGSAVFGAAAGGRGCAGGGGWCAWAQWGVVRGDVVVLGAGRGRGAQKAPPQGAQRCGVSGSTTSRENARTVCGARGAVSCVCGAGSTWRKGVQHTGERDRCSTAHRGQGEEESGCANQWQQEEGMCGGGARKNSELSAFAALPSRPRSKHSPNARPDSHRATMWRPSANIPMALCCFLAALLAATTALAATAPPPPPPPLCWMPRRPPRHSSALAA